MLKRVILIGGGHAHLFVVSKAADFKAAGLEIALIDPGLLWYSGMATGMLGGYYAPEDDQINLRALCEEYGVSFYEARATGVKVDEKTVLLETGESIPYDVLSLNVGSIVATRGIEDPERLAWTVKPIADLLELKTALRGRLQQKGTVRVGVVGAGPTGCEIAANIQALCHRLGGTAEITLLCGSERILSNFPERAAEKLSKVLRERGTKIELATRAKKIQKTDDGILVTSEDGSTFVFDEVVLATGLVPSPAVGELGLGRDGLQTDKTLAASRIPDIFGAGDCITFASGKLPKVGVYGVRQAPVLKDNLIASALGRPLKEYQPQDKFLIILNLGDGTGLAIRGGLYWYGRLSFLLKNFIDRRFMAKYQI